MSVKLVFPFHVRNALTDISKLRDQIDLVISVSDARSLEATDLTDKLKSIFKGKNTKILNLVSKSDLSDIKYPNSFNFKNSKSRGPIIKLILNTLEVSKYHKQGYKPHFQVLVVGIPNTGKSTLINLLKSKKVAIAENMPGKTKKISKFPLVDNIWIYDTPGILTYKDAKASSSQKLFLLNSTPATIKDYSHFLKDAYQYLKEHYLPELRELLDKEAPKDYDEFLISLANRYKFVLPGQIPDISRAENKFLTWLREGKIKLNWDRE